MPQEQKEKMIKTIKETKKNGLYKQKYIIKKKVNCYTLENDFICNFESMTEASKQTSISKCEISMCCNNKRKTAKGFIWKLV